jgi:hypothetical protein
LITIIVYIIANVVTTYAALLGEITDVEAFLKRAGRGCDEAASKLQDWNHLFTISSRDLKELGLPTKQRKYILSRVEFFRQGIDPYPIATKKPKKK